MTGLYVRILRDGRGQTVELEDMTADEWPAFVATRPPEEGWAFARALALWIRDHVREEPA